MSGVYGRKVREPKVTLRTRLPFPKLESQAGDLEKAWSTFGEAKDILRRIETDQLTPLVDKTRGKVQRVKFTPDEVDRGTRKAFHTGVGTAREDRGLLEEHEEGNGRECEYLVEPAPLNVGHYHRESRESPFTNGTYPYDAGAARYTPGIVITAPAVSSSSPYPSHGSHNARAGSPSRWNPRAVYSRGSWQSPSTSGRNGAELLPRTSTEPCRSPSVTRGTTIASSTSLPYPSASPYAHPTSCGASSSSSLQPRRRAWEPPHLTASHTSPRRYTEEEEVRLENLRARVEGQKKAVAAVSDRVSSLQQQRLQNKHGFYPLSEASHTSTPSHSTDPTPNHTQPHSHAASSHYTRHRYTHTLQPSATATGCTNAPPKRRKVVYVPPPSSYTGFSSTSTERTRKTHFAPSHPHVMASGEAAPHWKERENRAPFPSSVGAPKVRKVRRMCTACADTDEDPLNTAGLVTTSSWRSGKKLAEKLLRSGEASKVGKEEALERKRNLDRVLGCHSPLASSMHSFDQDSIECEFNRDPSFPHLRGSHDRDHGSGFGHPREHAHSPATIGSSANELAGGAPSTSSLLDVRAAQLSSDMRQLMDELKVSPPPPSSSVGHYNEEAEGKEGGRRSVTSRPWREGRGDRFTSASRPVAKKPKFSNEPVFATVKVRHYDQAEIQSYIQEKKAERRKKALQEQESNEQGAKHKEKKLQHLYENQRRRVESNLRFKLRQREALTTTSPLTRTSPTSAAIHIHIQSPVAELEPDQHDPLSTHYLSSAWTRSPGTTYTTHTRVTPSPHTTPTANLRPSSPVHPLPSSHSLSPRYSSHYITPHSSRPSGSPRDHTHSISTSTSPCTYSVPASRHHSPSDRSPRERDFIATPLSCGLPAHTSTRFPGYVSYNSHVTSRSPTLSTAASSAGTKLTTHPKLPSSLRGKTREERIEAITASALALKEKILEQSRRLEEGPGHVPSVTYHAEDPGERRFSWRVDYQQRGNGEQSSRLTGHYSSSGFVSQDLPGVKSLKEHVSQAETVRQENEAATKIQAAYRGYSVRKSLHWELPSGGTLGEVMQGGRKGGDGVEEEEEEAGSVDEETPTHSDEGGLLPTGERVGVAPSNAETRKNTSGSLTPQRRKPMQVTAPVVPTEPWKRDGGDVHSVINVFTRRHQQDWDCEKVIGESGGKRNVKKDLRSPVPRSGVSPYHAASPPLSSTSGESGNLTYSGGFENSSANTPALNSSSSVGNTPALNSSSSVGPALNSSTSTAGEMSGKSSGKGDEERRVGEVLMELSGSDLSEQYTRDSLQSDASPALKVPASSQLTSTPTKRTPLPSDRRSPENTAKTSKERKRVEVREDAASVPAISPLSPSFVESSTNSSGTQQPIPQLPKYGAGGGSKDPAATSVEKVGRFSPRSLELKLQAELSHWEVVTDTMDHMTELERTRAIARTKQETENIVQVLKSQQLTLEKEIESMSCKVMQDRKQDKEVARNCRDKAVQVSSEETRKVREEEGGRMREPSNWLAHVEEQAVPDLTSRLQEVQSRAHAGHGSSVPVEQMVSTDPRETVSIVQERLKPPAALDSKTPSTSEKLMKYKDDFETGSSSIRTESGVITEPPSGERRVKGGVGGTDSLPLIPSLRKREDSEVTEELEEDVDKQRSEIMEQLEEEESEVVPEEEETDIAEDLEAGESERDGSAEGDTSRRSVSDVLSEEESAGGVDIDKVSFRELLPSETHRRRRHQNSQPPRRRYPRTHTLRSRTSSAITTSDFDDRLSSVSPSQLDGSRPLTPALSEVSLLSPSRDSFFHFMSRMVRVYMEEEEVRAKHQSALLQLREDAIKERTKAELEWLKLRERELKVKGADEQMPPLKKREKGLLKKLQQQQAEIQTLKQVQAAARQERKMMMLQHKDISKMRRSTQFYRQKIHKYRHHTKSATPSLEQNQYEHETQRSLDRSRMSLEGLSSGMLSDADQESSVPPSEHLEDSFLSYTPLKEDHSSVTEALERIGSSSKSTPSTSLTHQTRSRGSLISTSPLRAPSETDQTLPPRDSARSLTEREQRLMKRKQAAGEVLQQQKLLLQREQELGREEESMATQTTTQTYQQRKRETENKVAVAHREGRGEDLSIAEIISVSQSSLTAATDAPSSLYKMPRVVSSVSEQIATSPSITEVMSDEFLTSQSLRNHKGGSVRIPSEYAHDTFESLDASTSFAHTEPSPSHPVSSSTPSSGHAPRGHSIGQGKDEDTVESIHAMSEGLSESITITSDGSAIEARICLLKKQLHQRQEEMKRVTNERNRRRKERLRIQEEQLMKQLKAVESKVIQMKSSPSPVYSGPASATHSPTRSDVSDIELPSRPESTSPDEEDKSMFGTEGEMQEELKEDIRRSRTSSGNKSGTGSPVEEGRLSLPSVSPYYTSFTESVESRAEAHSKEIDVESGEDLQPVEMLSGEKLLEEVPPGGEQEERQERGSFERESGHESYIEEEIQGEDGSDKDIDSSLHYEPASSFEGGEERVDEDAASMDSSTGKLSLSHSEDQEQGDPQHSILHMSESVLISTTSSIGGDKQEQNSFQVGTPVLIGNRMMGVVRYVGQTHFATGIWVGVEIGVPKGRNDGSIDGQRYFTCDHNYGLFAPPHKLTLIAEADARSSISEDISECVESDVEEVEQTSQVEEGSLEHEFSKQEVEKTEKKDTLVEQEQDQEKEEEEYKMESLFVDASVIQEEEEESEGDMKRDGKSLNITVSGGSLISEDMSSSSSSFSSSSSMEQAVHASHSDREEQARGDKHNGLSGETSRESSTEPQSVMMFDTRNIVPSSERNSISNRFSDELVLDLTNEAYETMQQIRREKQNRHHHHRDISEEGKEEKGEDVVSAKTTMARKEAFQSMSMEEKAELITDQLISVLLKNESHFACDVHSNKRLSSSEGRLEEEGIWDNKNDKVANGFIEAASDSRKVAPAISDEVWPSNLTPSTTPPHLVIHTSSTSGSGPPAPLSPPLHHTPLHLLPGINSSHPLQSSSDHSPPGSPPRHLSQLSAARVAAGDKSPPLSPPPQSPSPPLLERSTSVESVVQLLDSIKVTTAQCMVPSERKTVDKIVACAWNEASHDGFHNVRSIFTPEANCPLPDEVLAFIHKRGADDDEAEVDGMSPAETRCREAYVGLVYQVALEMIQQLHPVKGPTPVWTSHCTTRSLLVPTHFPGMDLPSLVHVQDRVYASLMRGQLANQLPNVKFLHQMKRPGGREVDFVDQVLIQELRHEEPEWVDYSKDEMSVKEKMADSLLESLVDETANILNGIAEKRRRR